MKLVRALIVASVALVTAVVVQTAGSTSASAAPVNVNDCGACWFIVGH